MSSQRSKVKKTFVHSREVSIKTFDLGDQHILVEGRLKDHGYRPGKESFERGIVHNMVVRFQVKGPEMVIEKAEAEMPYHPRKECTEALPWIRQLEGMEIAPGYSGKVKKTIGGIKGCAHITSLVMAMGEAAVQGYWAANAAKGKIGPREQKQAAKKFINTCHLWKEDGLIVREIRQASKDSSE